MLFHTLITASMHPWESVFLHSGLGVLEELGPAASTFVYNVGTKVSGSGVSSVIYAGAESEQSRSYTRTYNQKLRRE
ncbi:hypothetical protein [Enterococcus sp. DIV0187]|uniref:hypothetical protein n=1 Tax=Enterococcus sp. DIV0187 TaxID=2774644 RepID=UPI003F25092C